MTTTAQIVLDTRLGDGPREVDKLAVSFRSLQGAVEGAERATVRTRDEFGRFIPAARGAEGGAEGLGSRFERAQDRTDRFGRSMGRLSGVLSTLSPETAALSAQLSRGLAVTELFTAGSASMLAVLGPIAIALGAAALAWRYYANELKAAEEAQKRAAATATEAQQRAMGRDGFLGGLALREGQASGAISDRDAALAKARGDVAGAGFGGDLATLDSKRNAAYRRLGELQAADAADPNYVAQRKGDIQAAIEEVNRLETDKAALERRMEELAQRSVNADTALKAKNQSGGRGRGGSSGSAGPSPEELAAQQDAAKAAAATAAAQRLLEQATLANLSGAEKLRYEYDLQIRALDELQAAGGNEVKLLELRDELTKKLETDLYALTAAQRAANAAAVEGIDAFMAASRAQMAAGMAGLGAGEDTRSLQRQTAARLGRRGMRQDILGSMLTGDGAGAFGGLMGLGQARLGGAASSLMTGGRTGLASAAMIGGSLLGPLGLAGGAIAGIGQMGAAGVKEKLFSFKDDFKAGLEALPEILVEVLPAFVKAIVLELPPAIALALWEVLKSLIEAIVPGDKDKRQERRENRRGYLRDIVGGPLLQSTLDGRAFHSGGFNDSERWARVREGEEVTQRGGVGSQTFGNGRTSGAGAGSGGGGMVININGNVAGPDALDWIIDGIQSRIGGYGTRLAPAAFGGG